LPELHRELMARDGFRSNAVVKRSVLASLGECVKPVGVAAHWLDAKGLHSAETR
jgi:hypothetical protein